MFCANCGKELKDGDKFCNACGRMVTGGESSNNSAPYVDAVPVDAPGGKKLWSKKLITAISIAAAGVVVFCLIVGAVTAGIGRLTQNHKYEYRRFGDGNNYGNYDIYGGYGGNYGYPSGGSDSGSDKYGRFGNNNGSSESLPFADDPLPTDGNGNSASSPNYQWPSGDGKYAVSYTHLARAKPLLCRFTFAFTAVTALSEVTISLISMGYSPSANTWAPPTVKTIAAARIAANTLLRLFISTLLFCKPQTNAIFDVKQNLGFFAKPHSYFTPISPICQ